MSGLDKIKEKILDEARQEADKIIDDAKLRANNIVKENEDKADAVASQIIFEYDTRAKELKQRKVSSVDLEMRKNLLGVKQEMIGKAFDRCLELLEEMPADEYRKLIGSLILKSVQSGKEELILSEMDIGRLGNDFVKEINSRLKASNRVGELKLSPQMGSFRGGFILKDGGIELNNTFEATLHVLREELETKVAEMLF